MQQPAIAQEPEFDHRATYSPEDNKIRIYPAYRLPRDEYARLKAAGFSWAPKQEVFVAPMWTPDREDIAIEFCGELGDEDTSLVDRAEARAERFEEYSEKRMGDAERAREAVAAIADNIPIGQPILVGHHSERHARKHAQQIKNGMRRAVKMWETSKYWEMRAVGAIHHAKYKERPDVRARRIKAIETDKRKQEKKTKECRAALNIWLFPCILSKPQALYAANFSGYVLWSDLDRDGITPREARNRAVPSLQRRIQLAQRWITQYDNRLIYERTMLADQGGIATDRTGTEKGGACKCWASPRGGWSYIQKVNKVSVTVLDNWGNGGRSFTRTIPFDKLAAIMTAAQVQKKRDTGLLIESQDGTGFFLCDTPIKKATYKEPEKTDLDSLRDAIRCGVQVVSAPQLFPTPKDLADRMALEAGIGPGHTVLEPSAGTGSIADAIKRQEQSAHIDCIEINQQLCDTLKQKGFEVYQGDFLESKPPYCPQSENGFDRIVMNPPFENGSDIKHIQHALTFLKPGGRLVALCANGPRQQAQLKPLAEGSGGWYESLPAGSFKAEGTGVNVALLVIES